MIVQSNGDSQLIEKGVGIESNKCLFTGLVCPEPLLCNKQYCGFTILITAKHPTSLIFHLFLIINIIIFIKSSSLILSHFTLVTLAVVPGIVVILNVIIKTHHFKWPLASDLAYIGLLFCMI